MPRIIANKIKVLRDFGVTVTPQLKEELLNANSAFQLDRITRREISSLPWMQ